MKKSKVLVTGASGFVGTEIVRFLENEYERVYAVVNQNSRSRDRAPEASDDFRIDITDKDAVLRLKKMGSIDALIHSAGLAHQFGETNRQHFQKVNVAGTENVLELAGRLGVEHFVLISSVAVYGHSRVQRASDSETFAIVDEETECAPEDFYGESKLDGENIARRICENMGMRLTILRLATVIGEEDKGNFLKLIQAIDRGRFVWIGKGENYKSLVHREDVARACGAVLDGSGTGTEIFNVSANSLRMNSAVRIVSEKLERKIPNVNIPARLVERFFQINTRFFNFGKIKRLEKTVCKWLADDAYAADKIKRKHGFEPLITAEKAIEREVEWYIAHQ